MPETSIIALPPPLPLNTKPRQKTRLEMLYYQGTYQLVIPLSLGCWRPSRRGT